MLGDERVSPGPFVIPVRKTTCGLPIAESLMSRVAIGCPGVVGVNVTLILQLAPPAKEAPHVVVCPKLAAFVPSMAAPEKVTGRVPLFVRVTTCSGLDVFGSCDENIKRLGLALATGKLPC